MKRMKLWIMATFFIMFIGGLLINGFYNVISLKTNFFTYEVMVEAVLMALMYLGYIWIETRKHKLWVYVVLSIVLLLLLVMFAIEEADIFSLYSWRNTIILIYCIFAAKLAQYQSDLLQEDKNSE